MNHITTTIILTIILTSCASHPQDPVQDPEFLQHQLAPIVYTAEQAAEARKAERFRLVRPSTYTGVRIPERPMTYHIGRTLLPDGSGMREAHTIHTVQESSHWNLHGKTRSASDSLHGPPPILTESPISNAEIEAEKQHQYEITKRLETIEIQMQSWQTELQDLLSQERSKLVAPPTSQAPAPASTPQHPIHGN